MLSISVSACEGKWVMWQSPNPLNTAGLRMQELLLLFLSVLLFHATTLLEHVPMQGQTAHMRECNYSHTVKYAVKFPRCGTNIRIS